jgi:hypothetical protein
MQTTKTARIGPALGDVTHFLIYFLSKTNAAAIAIRKAANGVKSQNIAIQAIFPTNTD